MASACSGSSGEGEHGSAGGPAGDLYVVLHVKPHEVFQREGDDLYIDVPVPFPTLVLGGSFKVDGPAGKIDVHVSAGSATGARRRPSAARACRASPGSGRGALSVSRGIIADIPKKLSKEQKKIIADLAKLMPADKLEARPADSGDKPFFEKVKDLFG